MKTWLLTGTCFAVCHLVLATSAQAQEGPAQEVAVQGAGDSIAEIVVTAQKKSENIQDVPISITAVGSDELAGQLQPLKKGSS